MKDKDTELLIEAYMTQYMTSPGSALQDPPVFSLLESLANDIEQGNTKQAISKIREIQDQLHEISEQMRGEDLDYFANRLVS